MLHVQYSNKERRKKLEDFQVHVHQGDNIIFNTSITTTDLRKGENQVVAVRLTAEIISEDCKV